jgi:hypothetical protein
MATPTPRPLPTVPRLTLTILGTSYNVRPVTPDAGSGVARAWRLKRRDADAIVASVGTDGRARCECADFEWRRSARPELGPCKHLAALAAVGLFPATPTAAAARPSVAGVARVRDEFDGPAGGPPRCS